MAKIRLLKPTQRITSRLSSLLLLTTVVAILIARSQAPAVSAQIGGGYLSGYVYSFNQYDELVPVVWAEIAASNDMYTFYAYSGGYGFYEMMLPTGTFTLTASEPGYKNYSMPITISNGSSSQINFYLERSEVPIPEFSEYLAVISLLAAFTSAIALTRRLRKPHQ